MLVQQSKNIVKRLRSFFQQNFSKLDDHQSLVFLKRQYQINPSSIAFNLIIFMALVIILIQGLRLITIIMCYVLPIGIMILRLSQSIRQEKNSKNKKNTMQINQKLQDRANQLSTEQLLKKSSTQASNKIEQNKSQQKQLESKLTQQDSKLSQNLSVDSQNLNQPAASLLIKYPPAKLNKSQVIEIFIAYFAISLAIDLVEPLSLLIVQYVIDAALILVANIIKLIFEWSFSSLVLFPFQLIAQLSIELVVPNQPGFLSQLIWIGVRILITLILLKNDHSRLHLFEKIFENNMFNLFSRNYQSKTSMSSQEIDNKNKVLKND